MTDTLTETLASWFTDYLTHATFRDWSDDDFAGALTSMLRECGETPAALLDEFHRRPGVDIAPPPEPTLDVDGLWRRQEFLEEEVRELRDALAARDLVKFADALADIVTVVYGTAWRTGIPLPAVLAAVHVSNMTKTAAPGDGKAIKGPGYRPPGAAIRAALGVA